MLKEGDNPTTPSPLTPKPDHTTNPNSNASPKDQRPSPLPSDSQPQGNPQNPEEFILLVASNFASQPLQYSDPDVWGVLTAISDKARKRNQGINILLTAGEHRIGRLVDDARFQISSPAVSASHCKIYRKRIANEDTEHNTLVFLKDSSTNGTYLNWEKLNKNSPEARLKHGDIISIAFAPQHEHAFAFVFREVLRRSSSAEEVTVKRKAEEFGGDSKRLKGIGIGTPEGPISLDDFRSMQRSNTELRKQLEDQVAKIDTLRNEYRATVEKHETEMKDLRDSVSKSYLDQLKELNQLLEAKEKEIVESNRISAELKHALEDLNERLSASEQSCLEANEVINSQKASLLELKALLDEEREQRKEEREKAALDLKASIQRVQAEAQEEIKRHSDAALRREKEQQEMIYKLQESEKERCSLVETMRLKLEETRQKLVNSDNKARQLEAQMHEEQLASVSNRKRIEELEHEKKRLRKELEREKQSAREEAWAKVSVLELEINSAVRDLDFERRRLKAARERIMLRETQLRAFYSTTEEISVLFAKQQEQLRSMQRTLEDEENYENTSVEVELEPNNWNLGHQVMLVSQRSMNAMSEPKKMGKTPRSTIAAEDTMQLDVNTNEKEAQRQQHTVEAAGSWACSTAPSVHGENNSSQRSKDDSNGGGFASNSETESCTDDDDDTVVAPNTEVGSDAETIGIYHLLTYYCNLKINLLQQFTKTHQKHETVIVASRDILIAIRYDISKILRQIRTTTQMSIYDDSAGSLLAKWACKKESSAYGVPEAGLSLEANGDDGVEALMRRNVVEQLRNSATVRNGAKPAPSGSCPMFGVKKKQCRNVIMSLVDVLCQILFFAMAMSKLQVHVFGSRTRKTLEADLVKLISIPTI
nr:golgin subfamily A member 8J isoform X3 [Ipomoea batatas]